VFKAWCVDDIGPADIRAKIAVTSYARDHCLSDARASSVYAITQGFSP
jgi:hypothetical protein